MAKKIVKKKRPAAKATRPKNRGKSSEAQEGSRRSSEACKAKKTTPAKKGLPARRPRSQRRKA